MKLLLTTADGAARLDGCNVLGLANWSQHRINDHVGPPITVTGLPATHAPDSVARADGTVTGFLLEADRYPTVYVSGDNASLKTVQEARDRVTIVDVAALCAGAARTGAFENSPLTLTSESAAKAVAILRARTVLPVHYRRWDHFSEGEEDLVRSLC